MGLIDPLSVTRTVVVVVLWSQVRLMMCPSPNSFRLVLNAMPYISSRLYYVVSTSIPNVEAPGFIQQSPLD